MTAADDAVAVTDEVTATVAPRNSRTEPALVYEETEAALLIDPDRLLAAFAQEMAKEL